MELVLEKNVLDSLVSKVNELLSGHNVYDLKEKVAQKICFSCGGSCTGCEGTCHGDGCIGTHES